MKTTKLISKDKSSVYTRRRLARKRERGICSTKHCRNPVRPQRTQCYKCRSRAYYAKHPVRRLFHNLKTHAKARGIQFALSFEWFYKAAIRSGYSFMHGAGSHDLTVDRKDHKRGYEPENIQFLTHSENSRKGWYERHGKPWERDASHWVPDVCEGGGDR